MCVREKIVVVCNNKFFGNIIAAGLDEGQYVLEDLGNICNINANTQYNHHPKLVIAEIKHMGNNGKILFQFIEKIRVLKDMIFVLICENHQQNLAVNAINLGAFDVIFAPCEVEIMQKRIGNALEHIKLKQELLIDPLTQLYNRTAFETKVDSLLDSMEQEEEMEAAFIMIDLDNFKELNDRFGHEIGDRILMKAASLLEEYSSERTIVARLGGDEFAVFSMYSQSQASRFNRLQDFFSKPSFEFSEGEIRLQITSSVGISFSRDCKGGFKDLYIKADKAQYESKNKGKNKITIYQSDY